MIYKFYCSNFILRKIVYIFCYFKEINNRIIYIEYLDDQHNERKV